MTLVGVSRRDADKVVQRCLEEAQRLEGIFSLFKPGSSIRKLNKHGKLVKPPVELVEVLQESRRLSELSGGVFDVSIQPLWRYLYYKEHGAINRGELKRRQELIDYRRIRISSQKISFDIPGMEITLNGIAQGYITDCISKKLKDAGFQNVLVNFGEYFALGNNPDGVPWRIGIEAPDSDALLGSVELSNRAIATSSMYGLRAENNFSHLFNPITVQGKHYCSSISVLAKTATVADGLSTALSLLEPGKHDKVTSCYPDARIIAKCYA